MDNEQSGSEAQGNEETFSPTHFTTISSLTTQCTTTINSSHSKPPKLGSVNYQPEVFKVNIVAVLRHLERQAELWQ